MGMYMFSHCFRIFLFLSIIVLWYVGLFWFSLPICLWYVYRYTAYELLVLGVCIDIQFQSYISVPFYTTVSLILVLLFEWLRPHLSGYTKNI